MTNKDRKIESILFLSLSQSACVVNSMTLTWLLFERDGMNHPARGFKLALKVIAVVTHARYPLNASHACGHDKGSADATRCSQGELGPFVLPILLVWQS